MKKMNAEVVVLVVFGLLAASYAAPATPPDDSGAGNDTSEAGTSPAGTSPVPVVEPKKPDYPKDLGNGVEMINREDCPGGYCETFLVRPPPPGMGYPMPMMGMGMQPMMGAGMSSTPCCPQLPPSPCGGMQQPSCQLGPPPSGCNSPCPPSFGGAMGR